MIWENVSMLVRRNIAEQWQRQVHQLGNSARDRRRGTGNAAVHCRRGHRVVVPIAANSRRRTGTPERLLLFCLASDTDWQKTGVTHATQHMMVRGLIERDRGATRAPEPIEQRFSAFVGNTVDPRSL
jgi:hypothetical protein